MGHIGHTGQYGGYRSVWVILGIPVRMGATGSMGATGRTPVVGRNDLIPVGMPGY